MARLMTTDQGLALVDADGEHVTLLELSLAVRMYTPVAG